MRDTTWQGRVQQMVYVDTERNEGDPGGERGKYKEDEGRWYEKEAKPVPWLPEPENSTGCCMIFPKFHCELSVIERVGCHSKKHTRAYANGSIVRLRRLVPEGLDSVTTDMIKKFF